MQAVIVSLNLSEEHRLSGPTMLLTGLPRSGTTLVCALLNELPNTLALVEPIAFRPDGDHAEAMAQIDDFVRDARRRVLASGEATSRHVDGVIPDNLVSPPGQGSGLRRFHPERGTIKLDKPLGAGFHLFIKHLGEFTAMADPLAQRYPLVAIVRNPLDVLAAWQTVDLPINNGHLRSAECFSPGLAKALAAEPDRLRRQVLLLGWLLSVYRSFPPERILRYEDLVGAPQQTLASLTPRARHPLRRVFAIEAAERYRGVSFVPLALALRPIATLASQFYPDFEARLDRCLDIGCTA
jgi:hypothetical protein